jgi:hypothetical protein
MTSFDDLREAYTYHSLVLEARYFNNPTLRSTPLRLCGVNKMACLWHAWRIPLQIALIHHNNTLL